VIDQKAQELGRLLGQSDEYKALLRASDRMKEDATCRELLAEVERIAGTIERASQEGREPTKDQVEQYDRALQSVQGNREDEGQGQRTDLRGHETGGGEPHHHAGLDGVAGGAWRVHRRRRP